MKHTPGPWAVDAELAVSIYDAAQSNEWQAVGFYDQDGFAEIVAMAQPANVHIIAAAPEMLQLLKEAEMQSGKNLPVKKETRLKIQNIIAKVEGSEE